MMDRSCAAARIQGKGFNGPLFIVGMPRSGTKLLRDLLNRHPQIRIPDVETEFFPWLSSNIGRFGDLSILKNFERLHASVARFSYFAYRNESDSTVSTVDWHSACLRFDASGVFEALLRIETNSGDGSGVIWGDKSPSYLNCIPLLRREFPNSKVIHIVRDVRDYCLSIHAAWGKDIKRAAQRWAEGVTEARRDGSLLDADYVEVRYEDLLQSPERVLRDICAHIGIEFKQEMLSLGRPAEVVGEARGSTIIVADNFAKYRNRMSEPLLRNVEAIAGSAMLIFGYDLVFPVQKTVRMSPWEQTLAKIRDGFSLVILERKKRGLVGALMFHLRFAILHRF